MWVMISMQIYMRDYLYWPIGMRNIVWMLHSTFHMRQSYAMKSQSQYTGTPMYIGDLSGENLY